MSKVLVTGGAGYIGSHTCVELIESGYEIVIIDNLSNSSSESVARIEAITNKKIPFHLVDIRDGAKLADLFCQYEISSVIHFAGLKAVGESCAIPLTYYENNVSGTIELCKQMEFAGVKRIIFSSSATVYGDPHTVPIEEDFPLSTTNPYGASKLMIEEILRDVFKSEENKTQDKKWQSILLRYFNPVGAHHTGSIGEDPNGIPNNLMPYITQVACGKLPKLNVFGNDYSTRDGTGVRDYIHVVDLARGHVKALDYLLKQSHNTGFCTPYNLGTGTGYSVLEMIQTFEEVTGQKVPYEIAARRSGDIAECFANPSLAERDLQWKAEKNLTDMVRDAWHWQSQNPNGYGQ